MNKKAKCSVKGCHSKVVADSLCEVHGKEAQNHSEAVQRVTDLEAACFSALDGEVRNSLQGMRILDLETVAADRAFQDATVKHQTEQAARRSHWQQLEAAVGIKRKEYIAFVEDLAQKYGLDPKQMAIDPDARTLRDLRGEGTTSK